MKNTAVFCLFLLFWGSNWVWAQNEKGDTEIPFREDQFFLGMAYTIGKVDATAFNQKGFSYQLQMGFLRDIPLNTSGQWALAPGLGLSLQKLTSNLNIAALSTGNMQSPYGADQNSLSYGNIVFPLELRWRNATANSFSFWRIHIGASVALPLWENTRNTISVLSKSSTALFLAAGFNTWNIYLEYQLQPFVAAAPSTRSLLPQLINIGLRFYIL